MNNLNILALTLTRTTNIHIHSHREGKRGRKGNKGRKKKKNIIYCICKIILNFFGVHILISESTRELHENEPVNHFCDVMLMTQRVKSGPLYSQSNLTHLQCGSGALTQSSSGVALICSVSTIKDVTSPMMQNIFNCFTALNQEM